MNANAAPCLLEACISHCLLTCLLYRVIMCQNECRFNNFADHFLISGTIFGCTYYNCSRQPLIYVSAWCENQLAELV